ncbi:hypothetical protein HZB00_03900 [Candidatus Woesearchaeota archaeon]|nr:hypothetical protein [Candidatus Woesearchaeota archaeon]
MQLTNPQRFILYTLGIWQQEANKKFKDKPLEVAISKTIFIEVIKKAQFVEKQERALYKNLEMLEKQKLIIYAQKNLSLTEKGKRLFLKIHNDLSPYVFMHKVLNEKDPLRYSKKIQTVFSLKEKGF